MQSLLDVIWSGIGENASENEPEGTDVLSNSPQVCLVLCCDSSGGSSDGCGSTMIGAFALNGIGCPAG